MPNETASADAYRIATRARVIRLIELQLGRHEEELFGKGLLDSLKSIELALALEPEFGVRLDQLRTEDFFTVTSLVERIVALKPQAP